MRALVPMRFWPLSSLANHEFRVFSPSDRPYTDVFKFNAGKVSISESAYCAVFSRTKIHQLFVPRTAAPDLFDSVLHLGVALRCRSIQAKYMNTYMAYERIAPTRDHRLSAIRHALSHAKGSLSHHSTLAALIQIFGSDRIDFSLYAHRRELYRWFGLLLIEVDDSLFRRLAPRLTAWSIFRTLK